MDLRSYLAREQLSAADIAPRLGVHMSVVYRWIKGETTPSVDSALAIERLTNGAVPVESWASPEAHAVEPIAERQPASPPNPGEAA